MNEHEVVRPDWVRRVNLFGSSVGDPALMVGLDPDELMDAATISTGLADFGDDDWERSFRAVLAALQEDAGLNVVGRLSARGEVLRCLQTRLRLADLWGREPSVLSTDVAAPVFILGPPRTGTSIPAGSAPPWPSVGSIRSSWRAVVRPCRASSSTA